MGARRQDGGGLLIAIAAIALVLASAGALALTSAGAAAQRERTTERALAQAREALISFAADRPIDARVGPGFLPCPDLDDDGWAESTCGSLSGQVGQAERLGRLPWKTLGLPDLRDGHGERLWYAVSTRFKGLLNCAASAACVDMTPATALGTITVRDGSGAMLHDGTLADPARAASGGAAGVVLAPGAPLTRRDGHAQRRDCAPGECDVRGRCIAEPPWRAARCDPRNYLDTATIEDNADFLDRSDVRAGNGNGFIQGPVVVDGSLVVNDRVAAIGYADVVPRVMARVAIELAHCLGPANVAAATAQPVEACDATAAVGRVPDEAIGAPACAASLEAPGWWSAWRTHVLFARGGPRGLDVVDASGATLATGRPFAILVTRDAGDCASARFRCDASGCDRATRPERDREAGGALVAGH
jgi:hypothetical protein